MIVGCNNDDNENNEDENVFSGCCSEEPVFGANVNNLDETQGVIKVHNLFTPNGDGIHDMFYIENIELYPNHNVKIYNNQDVLVFESDNYNYGINDDMFPVSYQELTQGTYKYKIVVENEQTYLKSGAFCVVTEGQPEGVSFADCISILLDYDPLLTGE